MPSAPTRSTPATRPTTFLQLLPIASMQCAGTRTSIAPVSSWVNTRSSPKRLYRDSSLWNLFPADSSRALIVGAAFVNGNYTFAANAQAPAPLALGAQRHVLSLKWLGGGNYEWATHVDHAIGPVAPAHVGTAIVATLAAAEERSSAEALADARGTFPETGKHLAQLFSFDSLRTSHAGGATTTTFSASFRPERLRGRYPFFAAFVSKYVMPAVYRLQVSDHNGRPYIDMTGRNGQLVVRLRSRNHKLVSLAGVPAEMPDSLRLLADLSMKYRVFRVGFTKLSGDLVIERSEHQRAWTMRFQREPAWHFPLAVDKLIRNPLRRPFQGRGAELSLGVRNEGSPQTSSYRSARFVVNESAIMRWLGRLGATAFGDFSARDRARREPLSLRNIRGPQEGHQQDVRLQRPETKKRLSYRRALYFEPGPGFAVHTAIGTLRPTGRRPA